MSTSLTYEWIVIKGKFGSNTLIYNVCFFNMYFSYKQFIKHVHVRNPGYLCVLLKVQFLHRLTFILVKFCTNRLIFFLTSCHHLISKDIKEFFKTTSLTTLGKSLLDFVSLNLELHKTNITIHTSLCWKLCLYLIS